MTNKIARVMTVLTVAGLMAAGPLAYAATDGECPRDGKGYKRGEGRGFMKDLGLSAEQREQLKTQREAKKEESQALRDQMKVKMQALHDEISKPGSTRADVEGLVSEVNTLKGQMFAQKIDGVFAMKEVLTPEQFSKMQAKHQERMNRKPEGWGKHSKGPEGDAPGMDEE